jgi:hypothetical protein
MRTLSAVYFNFTDLHTFFNVCSQIHTKCALHCSRARAFSVCKPSHIHIYVIIRARTVVVYFRQFIGFENGYIYW